MREPARRRPDTCRVISTRTAAHSIAMARGATRRPTATCGIRRSRPDGARTPTAIGLRFRRMAGPGSATTRGAGQRITTVAGDSRAVGTGFRERDGARPGSRGRLRRGMSAGVRLATAGRVGSRSASRSAIRGDGSWCHSRTLDTGIQSITTRCRPPRFHIGRRLSSRRARRLHRLLPCRDHERSARSPAGGPELSQSARSAPGRQPTTVPGVAPGVAPPQPELGGARATSRGRPSAAASAPAGARTRSTFAQPPATHDNRDVPDTRTLGGRPPTAIPRRATPPPPASNDSATGASRRSYPPVTTTRSRTEQHSTVAPSPSPGYRAAPAQRAQPSMASPSGPPVAAQPRRPAGAPPVSAFQPPQVTRPPASPRGSFGVQPASAQTPRGAVAVPRAAPQSGPTPQSGAAPQGAPAQPASSPAGARSPRSR